MRGDLANFCGRRGRPKRIEEHDPSLIDAIRAIGREPLARPALAARIGVSIPTLGSIMRRNHIELEPLPLRIVRARAGRAA